jgi:hypothetical protein
VPAVPGYAFYPGVTEIGSARTIDLQPGADLQAVDLILTPKPQTYSIRGKLVDSRTGKPPVRASVSVAPLTPGGAGVDEFFLLGAPNQNYNPSLGTFEINGLLPGPYTVTATAQDPLLPGLSGPSTQFSSGSMPLAITSSDVEGIAISVVPAGQIPGRLRVEGQLPANLTIERIRIRLVPVGAGAPQPSRVQVAGQPVATPAANVATDGTFRFNNVIPGEYRPEITPAGATVFLKEARLEGADVLNSPLRFSGNTNSGLDIVIAVGGGQIVGVLNDARSQALPSTRVVLIPDRARYRSDLYRTAATDQTGRFAFNGIAPGDYKVFSWESVEDNGWFDPEVLVRAEGRGRSVHVTETSTETIDVRVIPQEGTR